MTVCWRVGYSSVVGTLATIRYDKSQIPLR